MRHPFDGIIAAEPSAEQPISSRREALALLVAGAASLASVAHAQQDSDDPAVKEGAEPIEPAVVAEQKYHLYYVVPKDVRLFDARRRMDLNVRGELQPGLPLHKELGDKQGFLAWLDDEEAAKVQAADDVALAHTLTPADVMVQGKPPEKGVATLRVFAAPIGWRTPPARETYFDQAQLGKLWSSQLAMKDGVTVLASDKVRQPFIQFAEGKVQADVIDTIKSQPQVYALQWLTPLAVATRRVGEDGIVTTEALREEAATTLALGEEGATTDALGEEGGSTEALGEEGGVTTFAIGEEGGISTRALGEEGGVPSTKRLGEEGGVLPRPKPMPDLPADGALTTQALGEEGGGVRKPTR